MCKRSRSESATHKTRRPALRIPELALDKAAVDQDRILTLAALQGRKDVVAELAVARLRAEFDRVLVVEFASNDHLAPCVFRNGRGAATADRDRVSYCRSLRCEVQTHSILAGRRTGG